MPPLTGEARYQALLEDIRREFPGFRLIRKDRSRFQRLIHYGLVAITAGGMRSYLESYQTTIGKTIYVTSDWDRCDPDDRYVTLRHELVHLRQFARYSLPGMAALYLLMPLPMGLAYFRARFEREAYEETIRASAEVWGVRHVQASGLREHIVRQFRGPSYGWMWPFRRSVESWYDAVVASLPGDQESR